MERLGLVIQPRRLLSDDAVENVNPVTLFRSNRLVKLRAQAFRKDADGEGSLPASAQLLRDGPGLNLLLRAREAIAEEGGGGLVD
eukprot:1181999-Amphidinium_carterae.1